MGDKENVVAGDSGPFWFFDEFQPKKEVNPPLGDLGLLCWEMGRGASSSAPYEYSSIKSSVTPSNLIFRSGVGRVSGAYAGILGMVGERACAFRSRSRGGWVLLTDRSCRGEGAVGLEVVTERVLLRGRKGWGAVPFRGVFP